MNLLLLLLTYGLLVVLYHIQLQVSAGGLLCYFVFETAHTLGLGIGPECTRVTWADEAAKMEPFVGGNQCPERNRQTCRGYI